jgi:hypothetical protein
MAKRLSSVAIVGTARLRRETGLPVACAAVSTGSLRSRSAVVVGLTGLAVTQPVLDLMGRNPEFFVAGGYRPSQIVQFGLVVALVPAVVAIAVVVLSRRLHQRVGDAVFDVMLLLLGGLFGMALCRSVGSDDAAVSIGSAMAAGGAAVAAVRTRPGRMLLELLSIANVLFLLAFLLMSPTSRLFGGGDTALGAVSMPTPPGPVVVIVFDELPVSTLMARDGSINGERFPAFARVAEASTWYRNASSNHHRTERAVPQLLTGTMVSGALPSHIDLPRNLLTMFAGSVPVQRYEAITDLCPPDLCQRRDPQALRQALVDASVVFGHRVLPQSLRDDLPAIDEAWGGFGGGVGGAPQGVGAARVEGGAHDRWHARGDEERSPAGQAATLEARGALVGSDPALHFVHVVLPHVPWELSPWGPALLEGEPERVKDPRHPSYDWSSRLVYQRHVLQVGAADVALGHVLDQLESTGEWEDTTLVVVADHGMGTLPPDFGRGLTDNNLQEVYRIPMFIKAPGQLQGELVDDPAQAIDVLPTIADLLDVELEWDFDGHSLVDGSAATVEPVVGEDIEPLFDLVRRHVEQVPAGDDWVALAAVGEHADLVGRRLTDMEVGRPSDLSWLADREEAFASLPTKDGRSPYVLRGVVTTPDGARPPELVVAVNGTIAGTLGGWTGGGPWRVATVVGPFFRAGANEVRAYEVDGEVLRPLG